MKKMTQTEIRRIVRFWQERLSLHHWRVSIAFDLEDDEPDTRRDKHFAAVWRDRDYTNAKLSVRSNFGEWSQFEAHVNICHEMLHLVLRDVEFILDQLEDLLHPDVDKIITEGHRHAVEGSVEHLAQALVRLVGIQEEVAQ